MKKTILIISACVFGAGLAFASPTSDAVALNRAKVDLVASLKTASHAERITKVNEWSATHAADVAALIPDIDEIAENNPAIAAWVIRQHLVTKNTVDGVEAKVFDQADRSLAAKLLSLSGADFYYARYATAEELAAADGTSSYVLYVAVIRRSKSLGNYADVYPSYSAKCLGKGQVSAAYITWFNSHVKAVARTDKAAALKLLENEQTAVSLRNDQGSKNVVDRIEVLRKQIALLKEIK